MKTKLLKILILIVGFTFFSSNTISITFAEGESEGIKVTVTEKVPLANCIEIDSKGNPGKAENGKTQYYECNVAKGFTSVTEMLGKIIKYFTYIAALGGVLFIVINGILYSMGGMEPSMKDDAKKRIVGTLVGLIVLFLSGVILNLIAPWIFK